MTCHRRYIFTFRGDVDFKRFLTGLQEACETSWWFTDPVVRGQGLGVLQAEFQVAARDQWWAHKRAMRLMESVAWPLTVPTPEWEALPPHENRGSYRIR